MADPIRVIVFSDCDLWVAQCLEYDIGAQAKDLDTLRMRLTVALDLEAAACVEHGKAPFDGIASAPQRFHDMWEHRSRSFEAGAGVEFNAGGQPVSVNMAIAA